MRRSTSLRETVEQLNAGIMSDNNIRKYRKAGRGVKRRYTREGLMNREGCFGVRRGKRKTLGMLKCILDVETAIGDTENVSAGEHDLFQKGRMTSFTAWCGE